VTSNAEGKPLDVVSSRRQFGRLWSASAISNLGNGMTVTAAPLLAASLSHDPRLVAGLSGATMLPWLVCGLAGGAVADRLDRKWLMTVVDGVRAVLLLAVALLVSSGSASLPLLYALFFLAGAGATLFDPASEAVVPAVVPEPGLTKANGRLQSAEAIGMDFVGPALGGLLFAVAAGAPFLVDAVSFGLSALLVAGLPGRFRAPPESVEPAGQRSSIRADIAGGLRAIAERPRLRAMMAMAVLGNVATFATLGVVVLFAQRNLGVTPSTFGLLMMGAGVGGLAGGLGAARLERAVGARGIGVGCGLGSAAAFAALATTSSPVVFTLAIAAIAGVTAAWCVEAVTIRQRIVPDELRGRVGATYRAVAWAGMPLGTLAGGFLASGFGLRGVFWLSAALSLGICAVALSRSFGIEPSYAGSDAKRTVGAGVVVLPAATAG